MTTDEYVKGASTERLMELLLDHPGRERRVPECKLPITRNQLLRELAQRHALLSVTPLT